MVPVSLLDVKSVREAIIGILSQDFPLSVSQLRQHMVRNLTFSVSYQAIHKEVCKLLDMRVLARDGRALFLNPDWILRQKTFFHTTHENYEQERQGRKRSRLTFTQLPLRQCGNCASEDRRQRPDGSRQLTLLML